MPRLLPYNTTTGAVSAPPAFFKTAHILIIEGVSGGNQSRRFHISRDPTNFVLNRQGSRNEELRVLTEEGFEGANTEWRVISIVLCGECLPPYACSIMIPYSLPPLASASDTSCLQKHKNAPRAHARTDVCAEAPARCCPGEWGCSRTQICLYSCFMVNTDCALTEHGQTDTDEMLKATRFRPPAMSVNSRPALLVRSGNKGQLRSRSWQSRARAYQNTLALRIPRGVRGATPVELLLSWLRTVSHDPPRTELRRPYWEEYVRALCSVLCLLVNRSAARHLPTRCAWYTYRATRRARPSRSRASRSSTCGRSLLSA